MPSKKRKLIFFWAYLEWGGAQVYMMAIMKEAMREWDVVVALPRNSSPEIIGFLDQIGVRCEFLDFNLDIGAAPTIRRKIERQLSRIRGEIASFRWLWRHDLSKSILHIETQPWQSWIFLFALSLRRANVFVTLHNAPGTPARWRQLVWKARMRFLSRLKGFHIFASNHDTRNKTRHLVSRAFWNDIAVTYTCVDPPQIDRVLARTANVPEIRDRYGIKQRDFIVLCVGQFVDRKGRWVYLDAAKVVKDEHPEVIFLWMMPAQPSDDDLARIAEYQLGENFRIVISADIGPTREDVLEFFRVADVFALPSYVEGVPIALLEAMALGLPSISTNVYAIPEAIKNGETGILIEAGDSGGLAREILHIKNAPLLAKKLSKYGRKYVMENFDERIASRIAIAKYKECFGD